jgi:hypothetical protein
VERLEQLIKAVESKITCAPGKRAAFFILQNGIRGTYVVYAVSGPTPEGCLDWLWDNVFEPLIEKAGVGGNLWWRLEEKITCDFDNENNRYYARTRIVVMDNKSNPIVLDDKVKVEGEPVKHVA